MVQKKIKLIKKLSKKNDEHKVFMDVLDWHDVEYILRYYQARDSWIYEFTLRVDPDTLFALGETFKEYSAVHLKNIRKS